jgi:excisionase family DNA binding protein
MAPEDTWVSIADAAKQLGVHPRTLRRYIKDGKLTVLRLSPQIVRIRPEDIARFRVENIKVQTGTGTSYVERSQPPRSAPTCAAPAAFSQGSAGSGRY